jgi:Flp pilus assembly pilin Flp
LIDRMSGRRFGRDQRGATMIEFALLGPVFFAVIGATLETALVFFAGQALDTAINDSARIIRTGQAQAQAMNSDGYRDQICDRLYGMFNCEGLQISVRRLDQFRNYAPTEPTDSETGEWTIVQQFDPGSGSSIVLVEAYYKWPAILNIPGLNIGVQADGTRLLGAARIFRNEPFG